LNKKNGELLILGGQADESNIAAEILDFENPDNVSNEITTKLTLKIIDNCKDLSLKKYLMV